MQAHSIYEKEIRRAKKEAFKSSSALVQVQEELKTARNRYTLMRVEAEDQRRNASAKELEASAAEKQLSQVSNELAVLKEQLKVAQDERDALKMSMKEEDALRFAAEGAIALPDSADADIEAFQSPRKTQKRDRESRKHYREHVEEDEHGNEILTNEEMEQLKSDLRMEKRRRLRADEKTHLLQMECQFGCCSCREAHSRGSQFVHDNSHANELAAMAAGIRAALGQEGTGVQALRLDVSQSQGLRSPSQLLNLQAQREQKASDLPTDSSVQEQPDQPEASVIHIHHSRQPSESLMDFSPNSLRRHESVPNETILSHTPSDTQNAHPPQPGCPFSSLSTEDVAPSPTLNVDLNLTEIIPSFNLPFSSRPLPTPPTPAPLPSPALPPQQLVPTSSKDMLPMSTSTTTIPLKDADETAPFFSPAPNTPGGISREEALEQIRLRRGRARSYAAANPQTPRRGVLGILGTPRREISAPAARRD